jgi:hypothetical protein
MYAKLLEILVTNLLLPILKDLAFMLFNFFKVREIRKQREEAAKISADIFKKALSTQEVKDSFGNLP